MELVSFIENIILHEYLMNPNLYHACVHTHLNTGNKIVLVTLCDANSFSLTVLKCRVYKVQSAAALRITKPAVAPG